MKTIEQTLSSNSFGIVEKRLLSEATKLKRRTKEILPHRRIYRMISKECETAYNQVLEALLELYEISNQEEIIQQEGNQKPF